MRLSLAYTIDGVDCYNDYRLVCWVSNSIFRVIPDRSHTLVKILYYRYARTKLSGGNATILTLITSLVLL